jgi:catechol 2,3-dioxygenase-like lactoylglutathione lyase family enzyme
MAFGIHHLHLKTRDPKGTMQFYVDNLGATLIGEAGAHGYRVNLHGLQLNITPIMETQSREQHYGIEHIGVDTDDYTATLARLRANGVRVLEELTLTASDLKAYPWLPPGANGRRVCFLEAPDGAQIEVIEKK